MSYDGRKRKPWFTGGGGSSSKKQQNCDLFKDGLKGLLVTCNLKEKECLRETYSLLNEYNEKLARTGDRRVDAAWQRDSLATRQEAAPQEGDRAPGVEEWEDVEAEMEKEIALLRNPAAKLFRQIPTRCKNVLFVQILNDLDPCAMMQQVFQDMRSSGGGKARFANRMTPVPRTCKATLESMESTLAALLGEESQQASSYMVLCKIRNNNDAKRMEFIESAARVVKQRRPAWKVDFEAPAVTVAIDIIIKVCCVALLPDYFDLKKYNLIEFASFVRKGSKKDGDDEAQQEGREGGEEEAGEGTGTEDQEAGEDGEEEGGARDATQERKE